MPPLPLLPTTVLGTVLFVQQNKPRLDEVQVIGVPHAKERQTPQYLFRNVGIHVDETEACFIPQ